MQILALLASYIVCGAALVRQFNLTIHSASRSPDGFEREVYLINGQQPGPLIDADEGDDLEIFVQNDLDVETTIHWHGLLQRGTPHMDGVPGVTQNPIPPGGNFTYRFSTASEYGFYWYHSHFRAYYNDAIRGPLLIRPAAWRRRPFETLAANSEDLAMLLDAEREATNILLNDWAHELSDVIFGRYLETGAFPSCVDSILANGRGRIRCLPQSVLDAQAGMAVQPGNTTTVYEMSSTTTGMTQTSSMADMHMLAKRDMHNSTMNMLTTSIATSSDAIMSMNSSGPTTSTMPATELLSPRGCTPPMMFNPGYNITSLPPETCTNTSSPLLVVSANEASGWLALNLVNSGAVSALRVSLDGHSMFVYAADGLYIALQEVNVLHMELGQRYSVMIKLNQSPGNYFLRFATFPSGDMQQVLEGVAIVSYNSNIYPTTEAIENPASTWMQVNGSAKTNAIQLDSAALSPYENGVSPPIGPAARTLFLAINQTDILTWVIDSAPFVEPAVPIIYGERSSGWKANTTVHLPFNSTIDIIMNISNQSMDTMGHPIHLHGHKFWVLGSGDGSFPYTTVADAPTDVINLRNPPLRDTSSLPSQGWTVIRYVTDNPGAWFFHCHLQWHLVVGMAMVLVEGEDQLPSLVGAYNDTAETSWATLSVSIRRPLALLSGLLASLVMLS